LANHQQNVNLGCEFLPCESCFLERRSTETAAESVAEPETTPITAEGPETEVPAPSAPHAPDATPEETPANNAPAAATDEKLLRVLARAFDGLSPEEREAKWVVLKNALATRKTADAPKIANSGAPREGSKISLMIAMLKREGGTTLEEIMSTMAWQKHTTRAMLSAGVRWRRNTD
jgi:hypothetical protein